LAQKKKPFSDTEMVKEIVFTVMETLLENYDAKVKNDILHKLQNLQLSRRTVVRRVLELSKNVEEQMLEQLKDFVFFSGAGRVNRSY
jgi:FixJ family two-component response regulator